MAITKALQNELNIRNHRIYEMYKLGYSFRKIAKLENLSAERISQIVSKMDTPTPCPEDCIREAQERELELE